MATEKEVDVATTTVEQPAPAMEETKPEDKPVKEKKPRTPREKKPKQSKTASHPPYFQMIKEALLALNEKSGSSPYAIAKYMEEKHKAVLPANFKKILALQLKNSAARGKLIKIKASYKLSETGKEEKPATKVVPKTKTEKKPTKPRSPTARKTRSVTSVNKTETTKKPAKRVGAKKKITKKSTPAKPKQPKSIKSPAAKRTKKPVAVASATS